MIKRVIAFLVFFNCAIGFAQTIKTDVLVIGGSPSGVAAAIQCARSKVKTILVEQGSSFCPQLAGTKMTSVIADNNWPGGIWGEFRKHIVDHYHGQQGYDTTYNAPLKFEDPVAVSILTKMADTVKNLTIQLNTTFVKIVKDGDRWDVSLIRNGNKQNIKARVVIDATPNGAIMTGAGGSWKVENTFRLNYDNDLYRTSVSMGDDRPYIKGDTAIGNSHTLYPYAYYFPIKALLAKGVENLLVTGVQWQEPDEKFAERFLRADLALGQGAGVTAAYCAFFKTTTANLNVRMIQGELLDFKGNMLPFHGDATDPYWRAIQQVCATGLLKPVVKTGELSMWVDFQSDSIVSTAEIKPAMLELYSRAFIWFNKEKPGAQFTIGNLLSFISELTLTDPDNLDAKIRKAWTEQFHFTSSFDLDRPITRREFAILANKYLNPFGRTVDLGGKVVN